MNRPNPARIPLRTPLVGATSLTPPDPHDNEGRSVRDRPAPIRRAYAPISGRRDIDAFERAVRIRVVLWSLVGAFLGFLLGVFLNVRNDGGLGTLVVTTTLGGILAYVTPMVLLGAAGRAGSTLYAPSGRSTPTRADYSLAESHAVRGEFGRAIELFEEAVEANPSDPGPYLKIARLARDRIGDPASSVQWFKRAIVETSLTDARRLALCRELVELLEHGLETPDRALPFLARMENEQQGGLVGDWASAELERIKADMNWEEDVD